MLLATTGRWSAEVSEASPADAGPPCRAWIHDGGHRVIGRGAGETRSEAALAAVTDASARCVEFRGRPAAAITAVLSRMTL